MKKRKGDKKMIGEILKIVSGKSDIAKGIFGAIFPKAGNTKVGRFFKGIVSGGAQATPLTFFKDFATDFLDADQDGKLTIKDFKQLDIKTLGKALGFFGVIALGYYLLHSQGIL